MTVFFVQPIRKALLQNDEVAYHTIGYKISRQKMKELALRNIPRALTPYGMCPDLFCSDAGNGLMNLGTWSSGEIIAPALTPEKSENYMNSYYINLFRKEGKWWNFWHNAYTEAENHAINLWAELENISFIQAKEKFNAYSKPKDLTVSPELEIRHKEQEALAEGYENLISILPGENFKESLARAIKVAPPGMPFYQVAAITHFIRRQIKKK
jgi:hypothetical protein